MEAEDINLIYGHVMEHKNLEIVKAGIDDCKTIARILVNSWQTAYRGIMPDGLLDNISVQQREKGWQQHLSAGGEAYLLRLFGEAVGLVEIADFRDNIEGFSGCGEVPVIYLLPEYYGVGLGSALMEFALVLFKDRCVENVGIWVLEKNIRAIAFYKKHGFTISQYTKIHKPTGLVEILLVRRLV